MFMLGVRRPETRDAMSDVLERLVASFHFAWPRWLKLDASADYDK